jgi:hypothetical protein
MSATEDTDDDIDSGWGAAQDSDDDIDSGWDSGSDQPAHSFTPTPDEASALDAAADELDAGWDIEPAAAPSAPAAELPQRRERQRGKPPADQRRPAVVKPAPSRQPSAKKLERAMSRKHREREARARAKRELERKAQRKAEQAKRAERAEELRAAEAKKREERAKNQAERPKARADSSAKPRPSAPRDVERRERPWRDKPADSTRKSARKTKSKSKAAVPANTRRIVGGLAALVALGLVAFLAYQLGR